MCFSLLWCWSLELKSESGWVMFISYHKVLPASAGCFGNKLYQSKLMLWFLCIYSILNPVFFRLSMYFFFLNGRSQRWMFLFTYLFVCICVFLPLIKWMECLFYSVVMQMRLHDLNSTAWPFVTPVDSHGFCGNQTNFSSDSVISLTDLLSCFWFSRH